MPTNRTRVALFFGGVSPEHEVSIITAMQAAAAIDPARYDILPVYVGKDGAWFTGDVLLDLERFKDIEKIRNDAVRVLLDVSSSGKLRLVQSGSNGFFNRARRWEADVVLPSFHGGVGENGSFQGLFEILNVPFAGSGVMASSIAMDKAVSKKLCREAGIPVVDYVEVYEWEWVDAEDEWVDKITRRIGFPIVVKPARLGSSIGIARVDERKQLDYAIEEAFRYDDKIVAEKGVASLKELNCSVLGDIESAIPSVLEQPIGGADILSYTDKYMRGSAKGQSGSKGGADGMASLDRIIPAPVDGKTTEAVQEMALRVFRLFECEGLVRIDFLQDLESGTIYFNEVNTIPGSFAFYLWKHTRVDYPELIGRLIELAVHRGERGRRHIRSYETNLLAGHAAGVKAGKQSA